MEFTVEQKAKDPLADSFSLSLDLPMSYRKKNDVDSDNEYERIQQLNCSILEIILSSANLAEVNEEFDDMLRANLRLSNAKMDLALSWLSKLLKLEAAIPATRKIDFNTAAIRFDSDQLVELGDLITVQLYLDALYCEPIRLIAKVSKISGGVITALFVNMHLDVAEKLDKYMFRIHRRLIANKNNF